MATYKFKTNINCGGCIQKVTPYLNNVQGLKHWEVDTNNPEKILTADAPAAKPRDIKKAVNEAGFDIEEDDNSFLSKLFNR